MLKMLGKQRVFGLMESILFPWVKIMVQVKLELNIWLLGKTQKGLVRMQMKLEEMYTSLI